MRLVAFVIVLLALAVPALALDPTRSLDQFGRTAWTVESGAPSSIYALAQSRDGYLWIGSAKGLYRFDGIAFAQIPPFQGRAARSDGVTALLAAKNGDLWVGHYWGGVSILRNGQLKDMNSSPLVGTICRIVQTGDGAVWVGSDGRWKAGLRRYFRGRWEVIKAGQRGLPNANLSDILAARDGTLWVALINGVARLKPGARDFELIGDTVSQAAALAEDSDGRIWIMDALGIRPLIGTLAQHGLPASKDTRISDTTAFIADRQGALWAASPEIGLQRVRVPRAFGVAGNAPDQVKPGEGILSGFPTALVEDREGDIWIGSDQGLVRLRRVSVARDTHAPSASGARDEHVLLLRSAGGSIYTVSATPYGKLDTDNVVHLHFYHRGVWTDLSRLAGRPTAACTGRDDSLWLADKGGLRNIKNGQAAPALPWPRAMAGSVAEGCKQAQSGEVWISADNTGLFRFDGHVWSHFDVPRQYNNSMPYAWAVDPQGRALATFGLGDLFRSDGTHVETVLKIQNIDIRLIVAIYCAGKRIVLGGEQGLMVSDGAGFRTLSTRRFPYLAHVNGISETAGDIWINSAVGLLRIARENFERVLADPQADLKPRIFDIHDGLDTEESDNTSVIAGGDGRLWITIEHGMIVGWIDPRHLRHNALPPPVLLQSMRVNGRPHPIADNVALPAGVRRLQIDYTATSLTAPEKVRFRYRLDGVDRDWVDAGAQRQAIYTNLAPGDYRFKLIAANEDRVWNTAGASLGFKIPPTFIQSRTFLALWLAAAAAALWLVYRLRLKQVSDRLRMRHEERTAERERIARELHDTLLQGVQGLIFRFQAATAHISQDKAARAMLEGALDRADEVVAEARDRVVELRRTRAEGSLPQILEASVARILAGAQLDVRLTVEGAPRILARFVEEELVRIAEEFMVNTFRHAAARHLDIAVNYGRASLSLQLQDDGRGIDQAILKRGGRDGHFGLRGMSERAERIGASFNLSSQAGAGVMVSVTIPAGLAYAPVYRWPLRWWMPRTTSN